MKTKNSTSKSVLVTGANGGLAKETIKHLVRDGFKNIVMACRSKAKGLEAKKKILAITKNTNHLQITVVGGFDMNQPKKIEQAIQSLAASKPFDIVFLAAGGVVFADDFQTIEWNNKQIERTIFQNVMGGHVTLLQLKKNNLLSKGARIVVAGGEGARGIPGMIASPNITSSSELKQYIYHSNQSTQKYNPMNAIGVSKLLGAIWAIKLSEIEVDQMEIVWFSPGLTYGTQGLNTLSPIKEWFVQKVAFGFFRLLGQAQNSQDGGRKFADCLEGKIGKNGNVIGAPKGKAIGKLVDQKTMNPAFTDRTLKETFWEILEDSFGAYPKTNSSNNTPSTIDTH